MSEAETVKRSGERKLIVAWKRKRKYAEGETATAMLEAHYIAGDEWSEKEGEK